MRGVQIGRHQASEEGLGEGFVAWVFECGHCSYPERCRAETLASLKWPKSAFSRSADGNLESANARNVNPAATKLLIRRRGELIGLHMSIRVSLMPQLLRFQ